MIEMEPVMNGKCLCRGAEWWINEDVKHEVEENFHVVLVVENNGDELVVAPWGAAPRKKGILEKMTTNHLLDNYHLNMSSSRRCRECR